MLYKGLVVGAAAVLVFVQFILPEHPIYDEAHYLRNSVMISKGEVGWLEFTKHFGPTGPGYAWIHSFGAAFEPIVRLPRVLNLILFFASIVAVAFDRKRGWDVTSIWVFFSFPGIWVCASLALTEMYSVFFISVGLGLLQWFHNRDRFADGLLLSGIFFALAVFSRQTLISLALPFGMFFIAGFFDTKRLNWQSLVGAVFILGAGLTLFVNWGGLLPNDGHPEQYAQTGFLSVGNFLIGSIYVLLFSGLIFFHIRWFWVLKSLFAQKWPLLIASLVGLFLSFHFSGATSYIPLRGVLESVLPMGVLIALSELLAAISFLIIGVAFLWSFKRVSRLDYRSLLGTHRVEIFAGFSAIAILLTTLAITHQFSSRYVVMCAPFVAVIMRGEKTWVPGVASLLVMNFLSIISYFLL